MFDWRIDNPLGLDISDLSVKIVQLAKRGPNLDVTASTDVLLPPDMIKQDQIINEDAFVEFLKSLLKNKALTHGRISGRSIVASVPESKAYVRVITLPELSPQELASAVPLEAVQYIPLPIDQVELDWEVVGQSAKGLQVLITASPKDYVESLVRVLSRAGFVLQALEAESAAISRCLLTKGIETPGTLIVDLDATRSSLIIYTDGSIQFTASVPIAGNALTEALAAHLKIDLEEAEHIKRLQGVPIHKPEGERATPETIKLMAEVGASVEPVLNGIFDEIKNAIKFHEEHAEGQISPNSQISQVLLCGGTAKLPNLADFFQSKFASDPIYLNRKIKVALGDPWTNIVHLGQPAFSKREAISYTTALGLALRNFV